MSDTLKRLRELADLIEENGSKVFTVEDVATILGISRQSAYEGVRKGEIPSLTIGRRKIIPQERFWKWFNGEDET